MVAGHFYRLAWASANLPVVCVTEKARDDARGGAEYLLRTMRAPLADLVVLVLAADGEVGRSLALAVAARGAKVVVTGARERALGEVVGEVAFGGGQARHAVGGVAEGSEKARATWGRVDFVVAGDAAASLSTSPEAVAEAVADALVGAVRSDGAGSGVAT